jgi:predicted ATPase with chaperone activity
VNARTFPLRNLAPADLKKDANGFDLPIALGLLLASGQVAFDRPGNYAIVGELALTGETRPIKGILAMALQAVSEGRDGLLVPTANAAEAAVLEGLNVYPVGSLAEAVGFLTGQVDMNPEAVDLDEMPKFNCKTLELLRQPLEEGKVTISRALRSLTFPADFILVAAMNPCPCVYRSDPRRACSCTPPQVEKYLSKISGPLLDRIDLHVEVPAVPFTQLAEMPPGPTSADLRAQVLEARARQAKRFGTKGTQVNGRMTPRQVRKFCALKPEAMSLLKAAMEDLGLSARAHDKVLRVARTIGDLEGSDDIKPQHIAEAVGYRSLDRSVWA